MPIDDKLSSIMRNIAELNAETDALNATLERIEKALVGSVPFWWQQGPMLCLDIFDDDQGIPARTYFTLGYAKVGGDWCIAVREYEETLACSEHVLSEATEQDWTDVADTIVPLRRAARRVRAEAAAHLEGLVDALDMANGDMKEKVKSANRLFGETHVDPAFST